MDYATILVHLDGSRHLHQRLHLATQLALVHRARLVGLFAAGRPDPNAIRGMVDGDRYVASFRKWQDHVCRTAKTAFEGATSGAQIDTTWHESQWGTQAAVVTEARLADLVVLGQTDPSEQHPLGESECVDDIVLYAGRPVLVVPYAGWFPGLGQRVVVAWNGSGEAARAIRDAMPMLKRAQSVTIIQYMSPDTLAAPWCSPGQYAVSWLQSHGVPSYLEQPTLDNDERPGELLLSRIADLNADLLVMGAYGRTRLRERVLGGVTRTLLRSMTVPILMSH